MAQSSGILFNHNLKRCVCTNTVYFANYKGQQAKFMNKLMKRDTTKRKWFTSRDTSMPSPVSPEKLTSNHVTRRMTVLNKLFMTYITDLMATGEASTELLGRKIEISRVKVTPDFRTVLVFWSSKNEEQYIETEKILNDCAFGLRHELTQLRVIGQVPMVQFIEDKQLKALGELDKRLKMADYGGDHEPVESTFAPKHELTLSMKLTPEVREKIFQLENEEVHENIEDDSDFHVDLAPMRHDVLGLDHHAIMTRVQQSLKKSRDASKNRLSNVFTTFPAESSVPIDLSAFNAAKSESQAFTDFLVKRQTEERRKLRRERHNSILAYNLELENYEMNDDNDVELLNDEKDDDIFDDINLESIK